MLFALAASNSQKNTNKHAEDGSICLWFLVMASGPITLELGYNQYVETIGRQGACIPHIITYRHLSPFFHRYFTWDGSKFPNSEAMINNVASKGRKMVTIVDPHLKSDGNYRVFQEAKDKGYYVKNKDGGDYDGWCWPGRHFNPGQFPVHNYSILSFPLPSFFRHGQFPSHIYICKNAGQVGTYCIVLQRVYRWWNTVHPPLSG